MGCRQRYGREEGDCDGYGRIEQGRRHGYPGSQHCQFPNGLVQASRAVMIWYLFGFVLQVGFSKGKQKNLYLFALFWL